VKQKGNYRILCLGESTTAGQWPPYLEKILNQRNIGVRFSVIDKGVPGIKTNNIVSSLESNLEAYRPDMVITMMGVNDADPYFSYKSHLEPAAVTFLKSCRSYKLIRLFCLHIAAKFKEVKPHKLSNDVSQPEFFFAPELNHGNERLYIEQGNLYQRQGKFLESEILFHKALQINPRSDGAYVGLGDLYRQQGKVSESESYFRKALELNPGVWACVGLAHLYREQCKFAESEVLLQKAIESYPENGWLYVELGNLYRQQGKYVESEVSFRRALELCPRNDWLDIELGNVCWQQGNISEAEELFHKALELNPGSSWLYRALGIIYAEKGDMENVRKYNKISAGLRGGYNYTATTISNYLKVKATLDKKGIIYVCMQYPMCSIVPLRQIFSTQKDMIFVDNEKVFRDAVNKESYREYFVDIYGGNFGHCTPKGNRLLAENLANVIVKEFFKK